MAACCSLRSLYLVTIVMGIINVVAVLGLTAGTIVAMIEDGCYVDQNHYDCPVVPGSVFVVSNIVNLKLTLQMLFLIRSPAFPKLERVSRMRRQVSTLLLLFLLNFLIIIISCYYSVIVLILSCVIIAFTLPFTGVAWGLQRQMWPAVEGLPTSYPHRRSFPTIPLQVISQSGVYTSLPNVTQPIASPSTATQYITIPITQQPNIPYAGQAPVVYGAQQVQNPTAQPQGHLNNAPMQMHVSTAPHQEKASNWVTVPSHTSDQSEA